MEDLWDNTVERLNQLRDALHLEKEEDERRYESMLRDVSLAERCDKGWTWYPVQVTDYGYTFGDNAYVSVSHTKGDSPDRSFRAGQPIRLYSLEEEGQQLEGTIHYVKKYELRMILREEDYPSWVLHGKYAIERLFDRTTYERMESAILGALGAKGRFAHFLNALLTPSGYEAKATGQAIPYETSLLNHTQLQAVQACLQQEDITVIHGPPGTGKTTTLVALLHEWASRGKKVLVCAPSNTATDVIAAAISRKNKNVLRIGHISRVDEDLLSLTLDGKMIQHPDSKKIKELKVEAAALRREAGKYKRNFGAAEREARNAKYQEARELTSWARQWEKELSRRVVAKAKVICATFINAIHPVLEDVSFDAVVIDEAGQALDPALLIPLQRAKKWVMAGDPYQLPPTILSREAAQAGLEENMLFRWIESAKPSHLLQTQYRMNRVIMGFSNAQFYGNRLHAAPQVANWQLPILNHYPLEYIDTAGCGFEEAISEESQSKYNAGEAMVLREHFLQLMADFERAREEVPPIAIISPYRAQAIYIRQLWDEEEDTASYLPFISIDTIDAFQGSERPIVYLSFVRDNESAEIGFLQDYRRINVALTRAQKKLILIGNSGMLGTDSFYQKLLQYFDEEAYYRSAWEFVS